MRIGIITDSVGRKSTESYPHLRDHISVIKKLLKEGHELIQLAPNYSTNTCRDIIENPKDKQEWFRVGVKPYDYKSPRPEVDYIILFSIPWIWNYHYKVNIYKMIEEYAPQVKGFIIISNDYESFNPKPTFLRDELKTLSSEVNNKVLGIFSSLYNNYFGEKQYYLPHCYDPSYEIPIVPFSEKTNSIRFIGPVGYRAEMFKYLPEIISLSFQKTGKTAQFFGESYSPKYFAQSVSTSEIEKIPNTEIVLERIFLPYEDYLSHQSKAYFGLHDSWVKSWNVPFPEYHTSKLNEALYSGLIPLSVPYLNKVDSNLFNIFSLSGVSSTLLFYIEKVLSQEQRYISYVEEMRSDFNSVYNVEKHYDKLGSLLI